MPIKQSLLKKIKHRGGKVVAQCPACAEAGSDAGGVHLVIYPSGKFGCAANPGDKQHRRRIAELVGAPPTMGQQWTLRLRGKVVMGSTSTTAKATPILSLARQAQLSKPSGKHPSAASGKTNVNATTDAPDAFLVHTHYRKKPLGTGIGLGEKTFYRAVCAKQASGPSQDIVAIAAAMFDAKVHLFAPGARIPPSFAEVLRGWSGYTGALPPAPRRVIGRTRKGRPVFAQEVRA